MRRRRRRRLAARAGSAAGCGARRRSQTRLPRLAAGELLTRAEVLAAARRAVEARAAEEVRRRAQVEEDRRRDARLVALRSRGEGAWREVEAQIGLRHASGYARAAALLADLRHLAERDGTGTAYERRLAAIKVRHAAKRTFIRRLERGEVEGP